MLDTGFDLEHPDFAGRARHHRVVHRRPGGAGRARPRHALHRHGAAARSARGAGRATASPTRPRSSPARCSPTPARGADTRDPRRHRVGDPEQVRRDLDVARRGRPGRASRSRRCSSASAERAQEQGTLIIAAAGNESKRPGVINPVGHPANCPSIMAVAAIDVSGAVARFSNRGINPRRRADRHRRPGRRRPLELAAADALPPHQRDQHGDPARRRDRGAYAEADPAARGAALARALTGGAQRLTLPSTDVGAGMVQAP